MSDTQEQLPLPMAKPPTGSNTSRSINHLAKEMDAANNRFEEFQKSYKQDMTRVHERLDEQGSRQVENQNKTQEAIRATTGEIMQAVDKMNEKFHERGKLSAGNISVFISIVSLLGFIGVTYVGIVVLPLKETIHGTTNEASKLNDRVWQILMRELDKKNEATKH